MGPDWFDEGSDVVILDRKRLAFVPVHPDADRPNLYITMERSMVWATDDQCMFHIGYTPVTTIRPNGPRFTRPA